MAYATYNQQKHNKSASSWFFMCGVCRVVLLMSIWGGGAPGRKKTRQPTSQKPCLLLLGTWQCEKCNWQVAMCNGQIEIMDSSSWWIPIGIRSYQRPTWSMPRLYRWGAWCSSPKSSKRFSQPILACTTPLPNQWKSCLSLVVGRVCTTRYPLCRGPCSIFAFPKKKQTN